MEKQYDKYLKGYSNSISRWLRFGPYYAMFPMEFAFDVIEKYSDPHEYILDPFFGRGTSIIAASVLNRRSLGIEINPLGWLYTKTKLNPASPARVLRRLEEIDLMAKNYRKYLKNLPQYFRMCFCDDVLVFLLSSRDNLNWRKSKIDSTLMSFILVYLHGKIGEGLSNQMRMTKSMGYNYSIEWWRKNGFENPPEVNPVEFIKKRIYWRYDKGKPELNHNEIHLANSSKYLDKLITQGNKLSFDPNSKRQAEVASVNDQSKFFKSFLEIANNKIKNKNLDSFGSDVRKAYNVARYSGANIQTLRFVEGGVKDDNFQAITEFRGTSYRAAPENTEFNQDLNAVDLDTDSFYLSSPSVDTSDLATFDCAAEADVVVTMDMGNEQLQEFVADCEGQRLNGMNFCNEDSDISNAEQNFNSACFQN